MTAASEQPSPFMSRKKSKTTQHKTKNKPKAKPKNNSETRMLYPAVSYLSKLTNQVYFKKNAN